MSLPEMTEEFAVSGKGKVWCATVGSASSQQLIQLFTLVLDSGSFLSSAELGAMAGQCIRFGYRPIH
ncbi:MAG: hypothetical protein IT581_13995 [Verrucomicrobiales bacterium]|nr:hypothetical protein [Verrucomicrobiales bacterium]